jgi:multiple sugar transport system ATP-binding protein
MARVILDKINKFYPSSSGPVHAVKDVSLEIADGELLVLVGPSGCGKSTVLRMIAGLEAISDGRIIIGDRVVNDLEPKARDVAMVFQDYALYPHMTVKENLEFGLVMRRVSKEKRAEYVATAAKVLGLEDLLDRKPSQLSGGQKQRVAVGRAIVREPQVFLFDEPLSNLDAKLRAEMRTEINRLHQSLGVTTIYVTHDQVEAMTLGNRIVMMEAGSVQQVGTPLDVYNSPKNKFVAGFLGTPPMNFIDGTVDSTSMNFQFDNLVLPLSDTLKSLSADKLKRASTLGVRPEHIKVAKQDTWTNGLEAKVVVVEPLGSREIVVLKVGEKEMTAEVDSMGWLAPGLMVSIGIEPNQGHLFDGKGNRIQ